MSKQYVVYKRPTLVVGSDQTFNHHLMEEFDPDNMESTALCSYLKNGDTNSYLFTYEEAEKCCLFENELSFWCDMYIVTIAPVYAGPGLDIRKYTVEPISFDVKAVPDKEPHWARYDGLFLFTKKQADAAKAHYDAVYGAEAVYARLKSFMNPIT